MRNGTARTAHSSAVGYADAPSAHAWRSMSVSITPGFSGTAAMPRGSSCASASVSPSTAYLLAQYGATSGDTRRPHPLDRFTLTPDLRTTLAGTTPRMTLATPFTFTSMTASNAAAGTSHSRAGVAMTA